VIELVEAGEPGADHQYVQLFDRFPIRRLCELRCIHLGLPSWPLDTLSESGWPEIQPLRPAKVCCVITQQGPPL
jgi:hypothetical protein